MFLASSAHLQEDTVVYMQQLARTGQGPHSPKLLCCSVYCLFCFVLFIFLCKYVLYYCHRLSNHLQLINISYHMASVV